MADPETTTEEWRPVPVPFFAEAYSVSNMGRVRQELRRGGTRPGLILKAPPDEDGYARVALSFNGRRAAKGVHQLVAGAFLGPTPEGFTVDHRDGIKGNNRADNFRFLTSGDNRRAGVALGLVCNGERCHSAVFDEATVRSIRMRSAAGEGNASIARSVGVTPRAIKKIVLRLSWKHVD